MSAPQKAGSTLLELLWVLLGLSGGIQGSCACQRPWKNGDSGEVVGNFRTHLLCHDTSSSFLSPGSSARKLGCIFSQFSIRMSLAGRVIIFGARGELLAELLIVLQCQPELPLRTSCDSSRQKAAILNTSCKSLYFCTRNRDAIRWRPSLLVARSRQ